MTTGWPDANNDMGAPMAGRDWLFVVVFIWAVVVTLALAAVVIA